MIKDSDVVSTTCSISQFLSRAPFVSNSLSYCSSNWQYLVTLHLPKIILSSFFKTGFPLSQNNCLKALN